jgi:NAD(P)-dependent dehydrogenase (short-subunit alcohol dehydrogenase family)
MVDTQMLRTNNKPEALNGMIERNVLRQIGKADEIAAVVAFLATHDAGFLTGETVHIKRRAEAVMHLVVCPATGFATMSTSGASFMVPTC